ncbi:MAG: DUF1292 domain-containing protein [Defluviitaleaceae bacterium]|nr:DUF1292 domain-containing protein [Defluviitaleaceae bacterium]
MSKEFNDDDFEMDFDDDASTIIMTDDDGNDVEFTIISMLEHEGANYILALESEYLDDEEASATVLKEVPSEDGDSEEMLFEPITDDEEFFKVIELFKNQSDEFEIEGGV